MAVGDIYKLVHFFKVGSELTEVVVNFNEVTSETDTLGAQHLVNLWAAYFAPFYTVPLFSQDSVCYAMSARRIAPNPGIPYTLVFTAGGIAPIPGGDEAERVPSQAAALIGLYSAHPGRSGRGRNYWPGVSVDAQNDGQLTEAGLTDLQTLAGSLITAGVGPDGGATGVWKPTIYSVKDGTNYPLLSAQARSNLATIRNRRAFPGVGT